MSTRLRNVERTGSREWMAVTLFLTIILGACASVARDRTEELSVLVLETHVVPKADNPDRLPWIRVDFINSGQGCIRVVRAYGWEGVGLSLEIENVATGQGLDLDYKGRIPWMGETRFEVVRPKKRKSLLIDLESFYFVLNGRAVGAGLDGYRLGSGTYRVRAVYLHPPDHRESLLRSFCRGEVFYAESDWVLFEYEESY